MQCNLCNYIGCFQCFFMENAIEAIMSRKVETIDVSESAQAAARKMREKKISSLVVIDKSKEGSESLGIVTERDLVYRICAEGTSGKDMSTGNNVFSNRDHRSAINH